MYVYLYLCSVYKVKFNLDKKIILSSATQLSIPLPVTAEDWSPVTALA